MHGLFQIVLKQEPQSPTCVSYVWGSVCVRCLWYCLVVFVLSVCLCQSLCLCLCLCLSVFRSFPQGSWRWTASSGKANAEKASTFSTYSQPLMGKIQWWLWWTSGASDNSTSAIFWWAVLAMMDELDIRLRCSSARTTDTTKGAGSETVVQLCATFLSKFGERHLWEEGEVITRFPSVKLRKNHSHIPNS